jgi:hypothetical protein
MHETGTLIGMVRLFALKWGDIDFAGATVSVTRSIVYGVVGRCKTEFSQKASTLISACRPVAKAVEGTVHLPRGGGLGFREQT